MGAAAQPAEINDDRDQEPQEVDSRRRHAAVDLPRVDDGGQRQEKEAEDRQQHAPVEGALQIGREEPQQG